MIGEFRKIWVKKWEGSETNYLEHGKEEESKMCPVSTWKMIMPSSEMRQKSKIQEVLSGNSS